VYRFRDERARVMYVGRAVNLRRRVGSYWNGLGDRRRLQRMVERVAAIEAVPCDSAHEAAWLERNLLQRNLPRFNRSRGGEEVAGWLWVDERPRSSRLTPVYAMPSGATMTFGPYLGAGRVRLAASALNRLYPVRYASAELVGVAQDIAMVRGVEPADRSRLVSSMVAVLERRPDAVAAALEELVHLRDDASRRLAFEFAAEIQAEIKAVSWIAAEQKVTSLDASDAELHGWSDGQLVTFRVRAGKLDTWTRRTCAASAACALVEQTPPCWSAFAARAAELAARLARSSPDHSCA
jgi:excinuclease ABC subunit C